MTLGDLLRAFRSRWPLVLAGALVTFAIAALGTTAVPVYHGRTEMILLAPSSTRYPNELVTQTESLIVTAGAVASRINGADGGPKYGSSLVNPVGAPGTGRSTWISLLDTGTQWVANFDDQILMIDAIGASPEVVTRRLDDAAALVQRELRDLQRGHGIDQNAFVTARMSPAQPVVAKVVGSRVRAIGATILIGGFLTASLIVFLETRDRRSAGFSRPRTAAARTTSVRAASRP